MLTFCILYESKLINFQNILLFNQRRASNSSLHLG